MESNDDSKVVQEYILGGAELRTGPGVDKAHSREHVLSLVLPADGDRPKEEILFATSDNAEFQRWRDSISAVLHPAQRSSSGLVRRATLSGELRMRFTTSAAVSLILWPSLALQTLHVLCTYVHAWPPL